MKKIEPSPFRERYEKNRTVPFSLLDKRILNRLQEDIPFTERPWERLADELQIKEEFLLRRIAFFKKIGIIRRISAVFDPRKMGWVSTLVAVKASAYNIKRAARRINYYPEVTHNYRRDAEYNLWFTLVAQNNKRITQILRQLKRDKNIEEIAEFPAVKLFKINVKFPA